MNKLISALAPAVVVLMASVSANAAYAADSQANANVPLVAQAQVPADGQTSGAVAMQQASHGLTRRDVYNQLVQAEKDGTIARLNATVYFGS